ncbi:MAG TPA: tetratricopeptide repeat protein [Gemmatimonadaceae bacterium]
MVLTSERDRDVLRSFARRIDPSDAGAHNNLGVLYYNKGLFEEAVAAFMKALDLDGKMQVARRNLEIAYFNTGYYDTRIPELRDRLRSRPEDREARWELGRTFALLGQHEEAAEEFRVLLQYNANDVGALLQLALAEKQAGDIEHAQSCVERALVLDPDSSLLQFTLGEVLYHRGLNEEALRALDRAIELNPENHDALYLMGFVLGDIGRHEDAQAVTRRAVKLNPALSRAHANLAIDQQRAVRKNGDESAAKKELQVSGEGQLARYNLGLAFRSKGYYAEALREYRVALERGEERDLVLQAMAEVHLLMRQPKESLALYDELLQRQPDSPKLWNERGVALHQQGRFADAEESYRRSLESEPEYAIAHNNLGVSLYHRGAVDEAIAAFRKALDEEAGFAKARLNLALLLTRAKRFPLALDAYRLVLSASPEHPVAWNGIGVVLAELRKFEDARNAFARAIQARPEFAEAHYNMSFTLSNLGDFEGALRETKRALELDPYYVAQKFELAMDVEYEDPDLSIQPDLGNERPADAAIADFAFDPQTLDSLFTELTPAAVAAPPRPRNTDSSPFAMATDYLSKGLFDRASAEINRAMARGTPRADGLALLGEVFARQGLFGEALERYREALQLEPDLRLAAIGEAWSLVRLDRAIEARPIAERLSKQHPDDVDLLMLVATACADSGDPAAALCALETARRVAPMRADIHQRIGDIADALGDIDGAIAAYRHALQLDQDFAVVRFQLARLLQSKGQNREAEQELVAALDAVPTYAEATLELAMLRRRLGRPADALTLLVELLHRDPYHFDALLSLGETLLALGRKRDAVHAFTRVLRFDPSHVGALFYEGAILVEQHRYRDAIARWEKVIELGPTTEYARRARRDMRTAADLQRILSPRARV